MSEYFAAATLAGQAKIAAAVANQGTINITAVAAGDGNGAPMTPLETMTGLVREVWRGAPTSVTRDPATPTQVLVQATIPSSAAPAIIRELALYTSDGQCFLIANYPATPIVAPSQGAVNTLDVLIPIVVDTTASVTIQVNPASLVYLSGMRRAPWISVDGIVNAPPANPAADALYVIGAAPTGAFAGHAAMFAQWNAATSLWLIATAAYGTKVALPDDTIWRRTGTGWALDADPLYNLAATAPLANTIALSQQGESMRVPRGSLVHGEILSFISPIDNSGPVAAQVLAFGDKVLRDWQGFDLVGKELRAGRPVQAWWNADAGDLRLLPWSYTPTPVAGPTLTLWVRPLDGSDSNDGALNTAGHALATIAGAVARAKTYALNFKTLVIKLGQPGVTYAPPGAIVLPGCTTTIYGDPAAPQNYPISGGAPVAGGPLLGASGWSDIALNGVTLSITTTTDFSLAAAFGHLSLTNVWLTSTTSTAPALVASNAGGVIDVYAGCKVSGNANAALSAVEGSINLVNAMTIGDGIGFVDAFATVQLCGRINKIGAHTFALVGAAPAGKRFHGYTNGVLNTVGSGINWFPGTDAGVTETGAQYV